MVKCTRSNFSEQLAFALGDATEATRKRLWVAVKFQLENFVMVKSVYCSVRFRKGNEGIKNYSRTLFSSNDSFCQLLFPNFIPISRNDHCYYLFYFSLVVNPLAQKHIHDP